MASIVVIVAASEKIFNAKTSQEVACNRLHSLFIVEF
jgi:hypothetical protein